MIDFRKMRELRWKRNLTQEELARMTGMTQTDISRIERGVIANPRLKTAVLISRALRARLDDIIDK